MTTSVNSFAARPRWRQVAATAAIFVAAMSVGTATTTTADAKPKPQPGVNEYNNCLRAHIPDASKASSELIRVVQENCCLDLGGIFNEMNGLCYLPNGEAADGTTSPPPAPLPGATAIPPPGALNPTGLQ